MPLGTNDPDRKYYVAILRSQRAFQYVAVLYGDVPSSYATGGEQMGGLTRRFHF